MILKDLMEEKQLNFNQPLLSVRRFASTKASERKTDNSSAKVPPLPAYKSELKSGPVRIAGNVPFVWEKAPGKPKVDQSKAHKQAVEKPLITPNFPPGWIPKQGSEMRCGSNVSNSQSIIASLDKHESLRVENKGKASSDSDDDGNETFLDALDTLSRTESFFMSSSVNGMSGLEDQEVKPSISISSSDQQARDFIIDRFLPAAKAMVSKTHQYGSFRKPLVGQEQQKQVKKAATAEKPHNQHRPKTLPHCAQDKSKTDNCIGTECYTATGCGLFPRLCILNPIPGLRMEDKVQSSAVHGMQAKSVASLSETTKEHARTHSYRKKSVDFHTGFTVEKDIVCVSEKSKYSSIDPYQRGCSNLSTNESTQHESSYMSPVVEKTLYVDSVRKVKPLSSPCSSEMKCQTSHKGDSNGKHFHVTREKATAQHKSLESVDMKMEMKDHSKKIDSEKQGLAKPINQGSDLDKELVSIPKVAECEKMDLERQVPSFQESSGCFLIENPDVAKLVDQECTQCSNVGDDGKIDLESQCLMKLGHQETSDTSFLQLPLSLPSLKAPSESWLKRTLPTISTKNIYPNPNLDASNTCAQSQAHTKWETIVKSSNEYQRLRKELLTTIPEA